ncbi:MAG: adenylate/guanylate cyclase domain-containing protein [Gaiellaceae bacterium]
MSSPPELPSGTVTLLFTDIEGSTRLLTALGEQYATVHADHQRMLREAFAAHDGRELDTQGDSFFVAFRRAKDAVTAAVDAQRALTAHEWPADSVARVRMGIHTGEPLVEGDRYLGLGVHRAARIAAAGHGGQVLLSNATRELVEDDLPPGVTLRDLGLHRVKDIDRPERLYQLVIEGLPADFPSLETSRPAPRFASIRRHPVTAAVVVLLAAVAATLGTILSLGGTAAATATAVSADSVGVVDAKSGRIVHQVPVGTSPRGLAVGSGSVWATNGEAASVSRIDERSNAVVQTIRVGAGPDGIVAGGGALWVANSLDGTVSRIDPSTNAVVQKVTVGNQPTQIAVGGGALWVANTGDGTVSKVDPVSGQIVRVFDAGPGANGVAFGAGSLWVTSTGTGNVSRLDPASGSPVATVNVGNGPRGVAFGAGSVWVANSLDGTVSRIDPVTNTVATAIPVGAGPASIAVGSGAVWVVNELGGTLARIDATTNAVRSYQLGNRPSALTLGGGDVYAAVRGAGNAHRGGTLTAVIGPIDSIDPGIAYSAGTGSS